MNDHLEIEYKTLLTEADYYKLLPEFSHLTPISQTNYYIDTPQFSLKDRQASLRIRILDDRAELTLKIAQTIGNHEYNQDLTLVEAQRLIQDFSLPKGSIANILEKENLHQSLAIWGSLHTLRYEMESPIGLLALDKNSYKEIIDYELELEVGDYQQGHLDFQTYLTERGICLQAAKSKVARRAAAGN